MSIFSLFKKAGQKKPVSYPMLVNRPTLLDNRPAKPVESVGYCKQCGEYGSGDCINCD